MIPALGLLLSSLSHPLPQIKKLFLNLHGLSVISYLMLKKNMWVPTAYQHLLHHFIDESQGSHLSASAILGRKGLITPQGLFSALTSLHSKTAVFSATDLQIASC